MVRNIKDDASVCQHKLEKKRMKSSKKSYKGNKGVAESRKMVFKNNKKSEVSQRISVGNYSSDRMQFGTQKF